MVLLGVALHSVWVKLFEVKAGLMLVFSAIFAVMLLVSLVVAERLAPKGPSVDAEDEFVKRYREVIGPYARWLRAGVVVVLSLIIGSQALGQWQNWLLFRNSTPFHATDPQFHRNVAYFVFTLPFQQFVIHWTLVALIMVLLVTTLSHYLNGGIRMQGPRPRVRPAVKAHLSVILGLIALTKAVGYYLARFNLDLSSNGYVQGAGYTDVHARLPALELLILVSLAAAALLIYNIRRQGWALPILGVGLWFLVALTAGTIYPAAVQALKVNPAQNTLERPYIQRNINATRTAMGINNVVSTPYPASSTADGRTAVGQQRHARPTSGCGTRSRPSRPTTSCRTSAPTTSSTRLAVDRYKVNGVETPGGRRRPRDQRPGPALDVLGEHHTPVHPRLRDDRLAGQRRRPTDQRRPRSSPWATCRRCRTDGLPTITQPSVYFGLDNIGLRGGQHQAARDRLPADQRQQRRDPLPRATAACSCPRSSSR